MGVETERTKVPVGTMGGGDGEGTEKACEPGMGEVTESTKVPVSGYERWSRWLMRTGKKGSRRGEGARKERGGEGWWRDGQG